MEGKTLEKNFVEENIETKKTIAKECSDCDVLNNSVGDFDKRQDLFSQVIAFEKVEEKVAELNEERENIVDEGPDNPLEFKALEAVKAMEDYGRHKKKYCDILLVAPVAPARAI
ncbi:hypothetical protein ACJJTC_004412 [Scirpophaga incertulas]